MLDKAVTNSAPKFFLVGRAFLSHIRSELKKITAIQNKTLYLFLRPTKESSI